MREPKPAWSAVPADIRELLALKLGSKVAQAEIAWGGYTPSASFLAQLEDGRRVFIKGTHPGQSSFGVAAFKAELQVYEKFPQLKAVGPTYICSAEMGDWHLMALEAIEGGVPVLPWSRDKLVAAFTALDELARLIPAPPAGMVTLQETLDLVSIGLGQAGWSMVCEPALLQQLCARFANPEAACQWLEPLLPQLARLELEIAQIGGRYQALHVDLRSDNMLLRADGRMVLLDWPNLCWGPLAYDLAFFINSVVLEGFGTHEQLFALASEVMNTPFARDDLKRCAANMSGYLASCCIKPEIPALPRLRKFQLAQLQVALPWLARLLEVPELATA